MYWVESLTPASGSNAENVSNLSKSAEIYFWPGSYDRTLKNYFRLTSRDH
ncbi:hypothetical protein DICPUDRAFT_156219 [Dictyostelium purpureum]|uniref:Uncharacterized protein n=1 Tax=Dictyostelium purpureum TaxID=5786 RepID=F0ZW10_DICPU|nr:uncharacterized protein DICPUDRAFT_156219 [Dictyostelium purpureum]EGC31865.1 hypothetical protein DICPUDRAFT_156219 [Dictyostelium purpureum]|eukprot:XP_003291599.1 hypothetical protein DICPUDRAFT_156219 [Dictyostelium purpureum]